MTGCGDWSAAAARRVIGSASADATGACAGEWPRGRKARQARAEGPPAG